jgi:glycosyltransferase involved in cell wall biosynthesis
MQKPKLVRITTIPLSLEKLLEGQLGFMKDYFEVTAVSSEEERLKIYGENEGVVVFHLPMTRKITPLKDLLAVWKLYRFLRKERPKIVHTHTPKAGIVGMFAAYLAKVPNRLHTVAGLPLMEASGTKRRILNLVEKWTYRFATKVYPNSQGLFNFIVEEKFTQPSKLHIIGNGSSNGIDTQYFSESHFSEDELFEKRAALGIPSKDFVFVFVGRIVKDKGIDELVSAYIKLSMQHPNCTLLLVGPTEDDLDPISPQTAHEILKQPKIVATGFQKDVRVYLALSDALVFPSYREGFPNVVLQAGAMGLTSIVSNINGCNEIIENGINGLIVPVKKVEELTKAMQRLLEDPDLFHKTSHASRSKIESRYGRSEIWSAMLAEYQSL